MRVGDKCMDPDINKVRSLFDRAEAAIRALHRSSSNASSAELEFTVPDKIVGRVRRELRRPAFATLPHDAFGGEMEDSG